MSELNNEKLKEVLETLIGVDSGSMSETYGMLTVEVPKEEVLTVIQKLRDDDVLRFRYLTDLCAVHDPDNKDRELCMVYHLHSLENNVRLRIKSFLPEADPRIASLTALFAGANWMERETYDFYGVRFEGHPDLRRILNMDEMDYFPLRKQYALEDETRTDKQDKYFGR